MDDETAIKRLIGLGKANRPTYVPIMDWSQPSS